MMDAIDRAADYYVNLLETEVVYSTSHVALHEGCKAFGRKKFYKAVDAAMERVYGKDSAAPR